MEASPENLSFEECCPLNSGETLDDMKDQKSWGEMSVEFIIKNKAQKAESILGWRHSSW